MKPLRVEFDMTAADLTTLLETAFENDPGVRKMARRMRRKFTVLILVVMAMEVAFYAISDVPIVFVIGIGVWFAFCMVWSWPNRRWARRAGRRQAQAILRTPAGRASLGPRMVEVGPDGFTVQTPNVTSVFQWHAVLDLTRTRDYLFVVLPGPGYLPIPARGFEFDEDFRRFCDGMADLAEARGGLAHDYPLGR